MFDWFSQSGFFGGFGFDTQIFGPLFVQFCSNGDAPNWRPRSPHLIAAGLCTKATSALARRCIIRRWPALICEYRYTSYRALFFGGDSAFFSFSIRTENCELSKKSHLHFFGLHKFSHHRPLCGTKKTICLRESLILRTSCPNCVTMGT